MLFGLLSPALANLLLESLTQTAVMVSVSAVLALVLGLPLGVLLVVTTPGHIFTRPLLNKVVGTFVNLIRSTPFIIMMVAIIPLTRLLVGTSVGTSAAIVPLTVAITPLFARLAETAMREVDRGLIEAAEAIGATPFQIIVKVIIPEALPGIVAGVTVTLVALYEGWQAKPTPEGVARATTRTVVVGSLAVLGLDFLLTALMFGN